MTASKAESVPPTPQEGPSVSRQQSSRWLSVPEPIRRVFDLFPLKTHPPLKLPQRSPRRRREHVLYLFASDFTGDLSCNPACLKWQTYLKFSGIRFITVASNNHASPSGSLPFILPSTKPQSRPSSPVPANKISKWVAFQNGTESHMDMKYEAYTALLDHRIRSAWLYTLYLDKANFASIAFPLYISSVTSNALVQATLAYQLRKAAREELLKNSTIIDEAELYSGAEKALEALSILLGDNDTYSGVEQPDLFDASVFAYTHLLLNTELQWRNTRLVDCLKSFDNLVRHEQRLLRLHRAK